MGVIRDSANATFRDYEIDGTPSSGEHEPLKADVRTTFGVVEDEVASVRATALAGLAGGKTSLADLNADLDWPEDTLFKVAGDPTPANDGVYRKSGAAGAGSWAPFADPTASAAADAEAAAALAESWAEGTEPGGVGTKSAKGHAEDAAASAGDAATSAASLDGRIEQVIGADGALLTLEDGDENVLGYFDAEGQFVLDGMDRPVQATFAALEAQSGFARIERAFAAFAGAPATWPDWLGVEQYGQSNAAGANGQPAITTSSVYGSQVLTFNGGGKADPDNAAVTMVSTINLVEDNASGDGGAGRGETVLSGLANGLLERLFIRTGDPLTAFPVLFPHTAAVGGQSIGPLSTTYYPRFTTSVQEAFDLATAAGKSYAVGVIPYDGNEANQGNATQAAFQSALRALYDQMKATVAGITGQAFDPIMLVPQKSWDAANTLATYPASVTLAAAAEQGDGLFVAFPDYCTFFRPESDGIHRGPIGHYIAGRYFARAAERILFQGQDWRGLTARSAWIRDGYCYVRFDVPVQPIVLDVDTLGAATQHGFKLLDASGDLPISAVEVTAGDTLRLTLGRARDGAATLRGGLDYLPAMSGLAEGSAGTNVRDSDTETLVVDGETHTLANWLLAFEITPLIMEA